MTLNTLVGRLQRLKRLAELVSADDYTRTLEEMLGELEQAPGAEQAEVDPALPSSLRRRLKAPDPPEAL